MTTVLCSRVDKITPRPATLHGKKNLNDIVKKSESAPKKIELPRFIFAFYSICYKTHIMQSLVKVIHQYSYEF